MTTTQPPGAPASYRVIPGNTASSVVIHVPHAATDIPDWVRRNIVLDDADLARELDLMTDARTDEIAHRAADQCAVRPWLFVNALSRLVIDPERFPDPAQEPMAAYDIGMGAVYSRTAHGGVLRTVDPDHEQQLMDAYFHPYASALADLVSARVDAVGHVTIVDLHSFPLVELPYERHHHADAARPPLCIGVDDVHTPVPLIAAAAEAFAPVGETAVNAPFAGTYIPLRHFGHDTRVASVMIELRRDIYLSDDRALQSVARMLAGLVQAVEGDGASL